MRKLFSIIVLGIMILGIHTTIHAENHGKPPVKELEQKFHNLIFQEIEEDQEINKVKKYDSKAALKEDLLEIMTSPLADSYLEQYFEEKDGDLYIIPQDGPQQLSFNHDYELEKVNDSYYRVTQPANDKLYTGRIEVEYRYEAGGWVFANRMNRISTDAGGEMPDTSSSSPLRMIVGVILIGTGTGLIAFRNGKPLNTYTP
ncbi:hypothetical protein [Halobacillus mangrovi]|uniref:DUF3993 domain-containing protein n=1 Tax=Halobacillus mangrovi TaxID=402384 RepID=A0A1W5ZUJ3_9BACI|nr:hypothetical protein [Halobacillus mangrovi]ARI76945.1 hypothetical protein HM131_08860 [Halobacillus mangrovi]